MMYPEEIKKGCAYTGRGAPRFVMWMSQDREYLQYDSITVRLGAKYPTVTTERFARWALGELPIVDTPPTTLQTQQGETT
jgi:hypothetical protein